MRGRLQNLFHLGAKPIHVLIKIIKLVKMSIRFKKKIPKYVINGGNFILVANGTFLNYII